MSYWIYVQPKDLPEHEKFERNLTWNNATMMRRAGCHPKAWHGKTADELRPMVGDAFFLINDNKEYFAQFNPPIENGEMWGGVEDVIRYLEDLQSYLDRCPDNYVMVVH